MVKKFTFWLESIVEDDPLPDEVDIIVFKVNSNGKYKYLEMLGMEKEVNLNKETFRPLEAQFFSLKPILNSNYEVFEYRIKSLIEDSFDSKIIKQQYKNKKIYLYFNDRLQFLFEID